MFLRCKTRRKDGKSDLQKPAQRGGGNCRGIFRKGYIDNVPKAVWEYDAATMRANQLRLWFASMAYVLMCALRRIFPLVTIPG